MAKKPKPQQPQQPGAFSSGLPASGEHYRAGLYAEQQKFGRPKKETQLLLSESPAEPSDIEITGLDLTVSEDKAFSALQILVSRTDYQGNLPGKEVTSLGYQGSFRLPRLQFTPSEYFEAYGLRQHGGRYHGKQTQDALEALKSLAEKPRLIIYKRARWHGNGKSRRKLYDVIRHRGPIIQLLEGYKDLEEQEAARLEAGEELPGRVTRLAVQFGPLLVDNLPTFFLMKPAKLYQEIEEHLGAKRISRSVSLFIQWLLTMNLRTVKIARENLARKLRLNNLIEQRKPTELKRQLLECYETARTLGFLLEYKEDDFGMLTFRLNPERCKRLGQKEEGDAEPPISG